MRLLFHRGPDNQSVHMVDENLIFGHARLSIIDLNYKSNQPIESKDSILTFNGEIYNYIELKNGLDYEFRTQGDTEVLLASYIKYGEKCVENFNGMFSFAIVDRGKNETYIVRDRLGIKPLYYIQNDKELIFSSEIKSILCLLDEKIQLTKAQENTGRKIPDDPFSKNNS